MIPSEFIGTGTWLCKFENQPSKEGLHCLLTVLFTVTPVSLLAHCKSLKALKFKKINIDFANSVDQDETAHHEPPHLDLYCLP